MRLSGRCILGRPMGRPRAYLDLYYRMRTVVQFKPLTGLVRGAPEQVGGGLRRGTVISLSA